MYFSRITINVGTADPKELVALVKGDVYAVHRILWRLFPEDPEADRDFLFRKETGNGWPFFYMVSKRRPQVLQGLVNVEAKAYRPRLLNGQRLSFCLRANPVVTKKTTDGRRVRHDVVMDAKHDLPAPSSANMEITNGELEYGAGVKWLEPRAEKLGFGFDPSRILVCGYQQHRFKSRKQAKAIRFSSLDFSGELTISDASRFCHVLFNGVGRAKAFGCGLMLVRRI